ncbi:low molecular weight protein-tyrosine-phosphatase YfkJ [Spirochaetota bacterium]|nr:low molecular weight protein-tyrosine-phosphatase YfkJ [Spirochaetota bacterium]
MGNYCRSPLAHAILEKKIAAQGLTDAIKVDSAGLGDWHAGSLPDSRTRENAATHNIAVTHRSRMIDDSDLETCNVIFCMDQSILTELQAKIPEKYHSKCILFRKYDSQSDSMDVPDPYYEGRFEEVFQIIDRNCTILLKKMMANEL